MELKFYPDNKILADTFKKPLQGKICKFRVENMNLPSNMFEDNLDWNALRARSFPAAKDISPQECVSQSSILTNLPKSDKS